ERPGGVRVPQPQPASTTAAAVMAAQQCPAMARPWCVPPSSQAPRAEIHEIDTRRRRECLEAARRCLSTSPPIPTTQEGARLRVRIGCQFDLDAEAPTPAIWRVRPRQDDPQVVVASAWTASLRFR